jgi:transposase
MLPGKDMLPLDSTLFPPIPADTANAAMLVIRNGNFYLSVGRRASDLFSGINLDDQSNNLQISRLALARLYLITIFQFIESFADDQAAQALQRRVDWRYALHLPLNYPGLQAGEFCQFRKWLLANPMRKKILQSLLARLCEVTLAERKPPLSRPNSDVLSQICLNNRLASIWSAISETLQELAARQPEWLERIYLPHWYQRYGKSLQAIQSSPAGQEQLNLAQAIGNDGYYLLEAISTSTLPELQEYAAVANLRMVWEEHFEPDFDQAVWKKAGCASCPMPPRIKSFLIT